MRGDVLNGVRMFKTEEAKEVSGLIDSEMIRELYLSRRFGVSKNENQR